VNRQYPSSASLNHTLAVALQILFSEMRRGRCGKECGKGRCVDQAVEDGISVQTRPIAVWWSTMAIPQPNEMAPTATASDLFGIVVVDFERGGLCSINVAGSPSLRAERRGDETNGEDEDTTKLNHSFNFT